MQYKSGINIEIKQLKKSKQNQEKGNQNMTLKSKNEPKN